MRLTSHLCKSQSSQLAKREAELRKLPLPARRIARRFELDCTTARLVASLAGLGDGGRHE